MYYFCITNLISQNFEFLTQKSKSKSIRYTSIKQANINIQSFHVSIQASLSMNKLNNLLTIAIAITVHLKIAARSAYPWSYLGKTFQYTEVSKDLYKMRYPLPP